MVDPEILREKIVHKYGSLGKFAEILGIEPSNLSNKIKVQSKKFMIELKRHGIDIYGEEKEEGTTLDDLEKLLKDILYEHKINLKRIQEDLERTKEELKKRGLL